MLKQLFSFNGRIGRFEYRTTFILYFFNNWLFILVDEQQHAGLFAFILALLILPFSWILLAQGAKRCHDFGVNGWYQIIPFYFLIMLFRKGKDPNTF